MRSRCLGDIECVTRAFARTAKLYIAGNYIQYEHVKLNVPLDVYW